MRNSNQKINERESIEYLTTVDKHWMHFYDLSNLCALCLDQCYKLQFTSYYGEFCKFVRPVASKQRMYCAIKPAANHFAQAEKMEMFLRRNSSPTKSTKTKKSPRKNWTSILIMYVRETLFNFLEKSNSSKFSLFL